MFKEWFEKWQQKRANYKAAEELSKMSDYQLKDIGITRGDIADIRNGTFTGRGTYND